MRTFGKAMLVGTLAMVCSMPLANFRVAAQEGGENRAPASVVSGDRVYCGGFVSDAPVTGDIRVVRTFNTNSQEFLVNGDRAFMNKGKADGVQVGDVYQAIRPRGAFYHPFKNRKVSFPSFARRGSLLGYFSEEVGFVRVISVQDNTAIVEVSEACTEVRLGDALVKYEKPQLPEAKQFAPLDPLAVSSGKTSGQIVLARNAREELTVSDVVVLDIGQKAGLKVGDYLTIYRPQGGGLVNKYYEDEVALKKNEISSDAYRGSDYSIVHPSIQREKLEKKYPPKLFPHTVVGEVVVTRVEGNTATAVITRTLRGEAYVGDMVELQ